MSMFAMSHHHHHQHQHQAYPCVAAAQAVQPPPPRQYSGHGTSSAFSSSANPDEDWTKISDLAERRRIQNRIAQRNYRKKLKRRLEDLERRAGTSDGASSSSGAEKQTTKGSNSSSSSSSSSSKRASQPSLPSPPKMQKQQVPAQQIHAPAAPPPLSTNSTNLSQQQPSKPMPASQFTPPMHHDDEYLFPPTYDDGRERSQSPLFAYPSYPPPPEDMMMPYGADPYRTMTTAADLHHGYMSAGAAPVPVPVTLPSMTHFNDAIAKREAMYNGGAGANDVYAAAAAMSYGAYDSMPAMDMTGTPSPYESNPHTPPLSHSFDHSANCSDAGFEYPTTPLSMPNSPGACLPQHL